MSQELHAKAGALAGAFDQARQVGDDEAGVSGRDHTKHGFERGERVGRGLRAGGAYAGQQGRLAGVRRADEAQVGDQLELEAERSFLTVVAAGGDIGRLKP